MFRYRLICKRADLGDAEGELCNMRKLGGYCVLRQNRVQSNSYLFIARMGLYVVFESSLAVEALSRQVPDVVGPIMS